MTTPRIRKWLTPGPVASAFMQSDAFVQAIMGPIGSGKTSANLMKMVKLAAAQKPSTSDGIKRFKFCLVRKTYRELWRTTIKTWWHWVPKELGEWVGGENQPATHTVRFQVAGGATIELIAEFVAIGDNAVEDVLRGFEPTWFYLNEADLLTEEVLNVARGRAGRYPSMDEGGPSCYGVTLDLNAPETDSWIYRLFFEQQPSGHVVFRQPSAFSPRAENLANLPAGYYVNQAQGQPRWYIRRMLENQFAPSRDGMPVFAEFNDEIHVAARDLEPVPGIPILIGADAGLTPAAVIKQHMPNGQWRTLDELVAQGMGPARFGEQINQLLRERYDGFAIGGAWVDPSAAYGADHEGGELSWIEIVSDVTGIAFKPAPSNELILRLEAVRVPMTRLIDGHVPGYLLSPRCKVLRKGYNAMYRYRRVQVAGPDRFADKPDKNEFSHPADADQYVMLGGGEYYDVRGRKRQRTGAQRQTRSLSIYNQGARPVARGRSSISRRT